MEFEIRAYKLSAQKTYQYVIDLQVELICVCNLAVGMVNMFPFQAVKCFARNLPAGFEIATCLSI